MLCQHIIVTEMTFSSVHFHIIWVHYAPINVKPLGGGGISRGFDGNYLPVLVTFDCFYGPS